jgi:hypothetical protein
MSELFRGLRNSSTSEYSKTLSTEDDARFEGCIAGWNVQMPYEANQIFDLIRFAGRDTIRRWSLGRRTLRVLQDSDIVLFGF